MTDGNVETLLRDAPVSPAPKDVTATMNYLGAFEGPARFHVFDKSVTTVVWKPFEVKIRDLRPNRDDFTIEKNGFAFVKHRSDVDLDALYDENTQHNIGTKGLSAKYEQEICELIKKMTGARDVFGELAGLIARSSSRDPKQTHFYPATFVHLDYTPQSARQFTELSLGAKGLTAAPYSRHCAFQVWRAISPPPQDVTLAICDGSSVPASDGRVVASLVGPADQPTASFDARMAYYGPSHEWYYLSDMEADDVLVFKGFDSDTPEAMNAMHSAFENPLAKEGEPRRSIEGRFIALFD